MNLLIASSDGKLRSFVRQDGSHGEIAIKCAIGKGGTRPAVDKREGDGASPIGQWPLKRVFYRADRIAAPDTLLPVQALQPDDGWCDAPDHPDYNRLIKRPFPESHEHLWREDAVYDVIVELGHNDAPPVPGLGSAIFMHVAKPDYTPTEGCVALALPDLLAVLEHAVPGTYLEIRA